MLQSCPMKKIFPRIIAGITLLTFSIFLYSLPAFAAVRKAKTIASIKVTSEAFKEGGEIPLKYAYTEVAGGENISIPLSWKVQDKKVAKKIKAYAISIVDRHPRARKWAHLIALNIPSDVRSLPEGIYTMERNRVLKHIFSETPVPPEDSVIPKDEVPPGRVAVNSYGLFGYGGPNPPPESGNHMYEISVYGLSRPITKDVKGSYNFLYHGKSEEELTEDSLLKLMKNKVVAQGTLRGFFSVITTVEPPAPPAPPALPPPASSLPQTHRIEISGSGVTPTTLNIKSGDTVAFASKDGAAHWPASNDHPNHIVYPDHGGCAPIGFDACRPYAGGEIFSFIFNHKGSWGFHDHLNSSLKGTIIVE